MAAGDLGPEGLDGRCAHVGRSLGSGQVRCRFGALAEPSGSGCLRCTLRFAVGEVVGGHDMTFVTQFSKARRNFFTLNIKDLSSSP